MKEASKIQLSPLEQQLVTNYDWLLTKNGILEKVKQLLAALQEAQQSCLLPYHDQLPAAVWQMNGKISKGENYRGLPYLVLDYPRYFNQEDSFAIRSLFWWGHFFSSTLHLAGTYKIAYQHRIVQGFELLREKGFAICVNASPWEHHFEDTNYVSLQDLDAPRFEQLMQENSFIKIAGKIPLTDWDNAEEWLLAMFALQLSVLFGQPEKNKQ